MSENETLDQFPAPGESDKIAEAINQLNLNISEKINRIETKLDKFISDTDVQFEAIRTGIVAGSASFDRLSSKVLLLSANVTEMQEEIRQLNKESVESNSA